MTTNAQDVDNYWAEAADVLVRFYHFTTEDAAEKVVWLRKNYGCEDSSPDHIIYHELPYFWVYNPLSLPEAPGMAEYYRNKFWG